MKIENLMTRNVISVNSSTSIDDVANCLKIHSIGFLPIIDNDHLVGVITDRDLVIRAICENKMNQPVSSIMTSENLITINAHDEAMIALEKMSDNQVRRLPVSSDGKIVGIITLKDLIEVPTFNRHLKQIYQQHKTNTFYREFINGNPHDSVKIDDYRL